MSDNDIINLKYEIIALRDKVDRQNKVIDRLLVRVFNLENQVAESKSQNETS